MSKKVLFILKRREDYNAILHSNVGLSTGLYNSASFMNNMLVKQGIDSKLVVVTDNNCIDREVNTHKPTHVIIEALWVVPEKFSVLQKLHPNVKWIIRVHSEMPFMAGEGMAMNWLGEYSNFDNVIIAMNAPRMLREVKMYLTHKKKWNEHTADERVIYLPNYYPQDYKGFKRYNKNSDVINVACFGAIRPLKNHLVQAIAAIDFANQIGKKLRFHINAGRIEMQGQAAQHNLFGLFEQIVDGPHRLVNHQWRPREEFLTLCAEMDIGMQCNFSETFNIVSADLLSQGVPLVGSKEIPWAIDGCCADPTDSADIVKKLISAYNWGWMNVKGNQLALTHYTNNTARIWNKYFT